MPARTSNNAERSDDQHLKARLRCRATHQCAQGADVVDPLCCVDRPDGATNRPAQRCRLSFRARDECHARGRRVLLEVGQIERRSDRHSRTRVHDVVDNSDNFQPRRCSTGASKTFADRAFAWPVGSRERCADYSYRTAVGAVGRINSPTLEHANPQHAKNIGHCVTHLRELLNAGRRGLSLDLE